MDQAILLPLVRSLTLGGAFSCTVLGLLFLFPPPQPTLRERISMWTGSTDVARSMSRVALHSSKPSLTGGFLLLVGILLFVRFIISEFG